MSDRWIVARHQFVEHPSLEAAEAEKTRLEQTCKPGKPFHVYRVKAGLRKSRSTEIITNLATAVQNLLNGVDTGLVTIDSPADETLANAMRDLRAAVAAAAPVVKPVPARTEEVVF